MHWLKLFGVRSINLPPAEQRQVAKEERPTVHGSDRTNRRYAATTDTDHWLPCCTDRITTRLRVRSDTATTVRARSASRSADRPVSQRSHRATPWCHLLRSDWLINRSNSKPLQTSNNQHKRHHHSSSRPPRRKPPTNRRVRSWSPLLQLIFTSA